MLKYLHTHIHTELYFCNDTVHTLDGVIKTMYNRTEGVVAKVTRQLKYEAMLNINMLPEVPIQVLLHY